MEVPEWLKSYINETCPYCGALIANSPALTDRYCSNPKCPEHMAHKINVLAKRFNIKGFGIASARTMIRRYKLKTHLEAIPIWFETKPELSLHEIGEICLIKGHQKRWREYCEGYDNMLQVAMSKRLPEDIKEQTATLLIAGNLCKVKPRLLGSRINVMLSGSFEGYRSRKDFITKMNELYGDVVQLVDVGKRKTNVDFLVKENYTSDHEKSAIAAAAGIPILSPSIMEEKLGAYYAYINNRRDAT